MSRLAKEFWVDEVVSPRSNGGFLRFGPAQIKVSSAGHIQSVSKLSRSKLRWRSKSTKRVRLMTPGLIDPHTHLVFSGNRADEWNLRLQGLTYQEIAKQGGGIKKTMRFTREDSGEELLSLAQKRCDQSLRYGVTTLEIKSGYGLSLESELKILRVIQKLKKTQPQKILSTFMMAHAKPPEATSSTGYIDMIIFEVLPKVQGMADFQDVFCESGYFNEADSIRLLMAGLKCGLLPKVHAHEFGRTGGVRVAAKVKAVSADHLIHTSSEDLKLLKRSGTVPVILTGTSFFLGAKKFANMKAMLQMGLKPALASDFNPGTNPSQNLPLVGTLCAIHQGIKLEEVLRAQTWHAARALRISDRGCIEPGFWADLACWDLQSFEEIYYRYGDVQVDSVYICGKKVF